MAEAASVGTTAAARPPGRATVATWLDYLRPLRFDHWIKNLVVPVGSLLALAARRSYPDGADAIAILLAFVYPPASILLLLLYQIGMILIPFFRPPKQSFPQVSGQ